jgi:hypothetical protein
MTAKPALAALAAAAVLRVLGVLRLLVLLAVLLVRVSFVRVFEILLHAKSDDTDKATANTANLCTSSSIGGLDAGQRGANLRGRQLLRVTKEISTTSRERMNEPYAA